MSVQEVVLEKQETWNRWHLIHCQYLIGPWRSAMWGLLCKYWSVLTVFLGLQGKRFDQDMEARDCNVCVWPVGGGCCFSSKQGKDYSKEVKGSREETSSCKWGKSYSTLFGWSRWLVRYQQSVLFHGTLMLAVDLFSVQARVVEVVLCVCVCVCVCSLCSFVWPTGINDWAASVKKMECKAVGFVFVQWTRYQASNLLYCSIVHVCVARHGQQE